MWNLNYITALLTVHSKTIKSKCFWPTRKRAVRTIRKCGHITSWRTECHLLTIQDLKPAASVQLLERNSGTIKATIIKSRMCCSSKIVSSFWHLRSWRLNLSMKNSCFVSQAFLTWIFDHEKFSSKLSLTYQATVHLSFNSLSLLSSDDVVYAFLFRL